MAQPSVGRTLALRFDRHFPPNGGGAALIKGRLFGVSTKFTSTVAATFRQVINFPSQYGVARSRVPSAALRFRPVSAGRISTEPLRFVLRLPLAVDCYRHYRQPR